MSTDKTEAFLDLYLKGETSAKENAMVERWIEENGNPNSDWHQFGQYEKDQWLASVFSKVKSTIHAKDTVPQKRFVLWRSIAAVAAVLVISFTLYWEWPLLHSVQLASFHVPAHQKKQIRLSDGSRVWINAESELKYPKVFSDDIREVYLTGEAYFDVVHDTEKPFIIHTGKVLTTVLGTAFNIRENKSTHTIEVTVTRGKVSVASEGKLLGVLTPNQQISYNTLKSLATETRVDAQQVINWQQDDLHFEDVSFGEAIAKLQLQYHVKISFSNNRLKNCRFTGTSLNGENLDEILKVICAFNNATYKAIQDGSILISGPGCNY